MLSQDQLKATVARHAIDHVLSRLPDDAFIGIGTGSTVDYFIDALASHKHRLKGTVASSVRSAQRLQAAGIPVHDLNKVNRLAVYIDGADEINHDLVMVKGGGAALTQEKIVASAADEFVCIVDDTKVVKRFGQFPLPVEVIPLARETVTQRLVELGGRPRWREHVVTDNGGHILDVDGLDNDTAGAVDYEKKITMLPGVITCGYFALRRANVALVGSQDGVQYLSGDSHV